MFDSVAAALLSPDHIYTAPRAYDEKELHEVREEAIARVFEYIKTTPVEDYGVHPLGFLNIPLFESRTHRIRIHIWYKPMFSARSPYKIHDHSYSSYSVILAGHLRHLTYSEQAVDSDSTTADFLVAQAAPGMTNTTLQMTSKLVRLGEPDELNLTPGSAYGLARDVFHYAEAMSDFVATLYFHLRHPDSLGVSRVAIPAQVGLQGPLGRFEYELLNGDGVRMLERAVSQALG